MLLPGELSDRALFPALLFRAVARLHWLRPWSRHNVPCLIHNLVETTARCPRRSQLYKTTNYDSFQSHPDPTHLPSAKPNISPSINPPLPPKRNEQIAIARWRIRRFVGAETVLIDCEMVRNREKVDKEFGPTDSDVHLALAIRALADESIIRIQARQTAIRTAISVLHPCSFVG